MLLCLGELRKEETVVLGLGIDVDIDGVWEGGELQL